MEACYQAQGGKTEQAAGLIDTSGRGICLPLPLFFFVCQDLDVSQSKVFETLRNDTKIVSQKLIEIFLIRLKIVLTF